MTSLMFWNLYTAGRESMAGDDQRWDEQVAVVQRHRPDILAVTEGWEWDNDDRALFRRAQEQFGYQHGELYEAKTGCHMAIFTNDPIQIAHFRGQPQAQTFWHGGYRATLSIPGTERPFTVVGTHLNPFDPTLRRIEGNFLRVHLPVHEHGVIVMDANTTAPGDPEPPFGVNSHQLGEEKADRAAVDVLATIGLTDVGAHFGDRSPTCGYYRRSGTAEAGAVQKLVRIDQIWATPSVELKGYRVIDDVSVDPELDHASDHRPVWLDFA